MRAKEIIVTREIKTGDKAIVNINIFLDNVPIEGGQSQDTAIIIGKDYLIPGFDKKLIGAKKGDSREFQLASHCHLYRNEHALPLQVSWFSLFPQSDRDGLLWCMGYSVHE